MSRLHPIMQTALAPFAPPPVAAMPEAPRASRSQFVYEWDTDCSVPVVCHLTYTQAERGTYIDPPVFEGMTLDAAYIGNVDVYYLLDHKQVARIEELALDSFHQG